MDTTDGMTGLLLTDLNLMCGTRWNVAGLRILR